MENRKTCSNCHTEVNSDARFCPNCGGSQFVEASYVPVAENNYINQQPQYQNAYNYQQYPQNAGYAQTNKKSSKTVKILLIILAVVVGFSAVFVLIGVMSSDNSSSSTPYTKGAVVENEYINEWANIRFVIPQEYPESDESAYSAYENLKTDCGFASVNMLLGETFVLLFEDIKSSFASYDASDYIDAVVSGMKKEFDDSSVTYTVSDRFHMNIAGEDYLCMKFQIVSNGVIEYFCVRVLDDRAITFIVSSTDENQITNTLANITTAK